MVKWQERTEPEAIHCLDLRLETDKGIRALRMRCSDAAAVQRLVSDLHATVEEVAQDLNERTPMARSPQTDAGATVIPRETARSNDSDLGDCFNHIPQLPVPAGDWKIWVQEPIGLPTDIRSSPKKVVRARFPLSPMGSLTSIPAC